MLHEAAGMHVLKLELLQHVLLAAKEAEAAEGTVPCMHETDVPIVMQCFARSCEALISHQIDNFICCFYFLPVVGW
jgi:hypothetical protein